MQNYHEPDNKPYVRADSFYSKAILKHHEFSVSITPKYPYSYIPTQKVMALSLLISVIQIKYLQKYVMVEI